MRLHRLEVEGFGPFRERQVVDFDALATDGIFLIGGKTGAGKSSILDAVCFALYGGVPRYDEGEKRIRSDHAALDEPTRVRLEFTSGGRRWAVERVPTYQRLKRSGRGTTQTPAQALLEEQVDGAWVGRASRPVDVGHELGPVLGLTQQQFLQVILLAQGRFARFLLARNDERQALLRTLFDSQRFGGYEESLERRRKQTLERLALENRTLMVQLDTAERLIPDDDPAGGHDEAVANVVELSIDERVARVRQARLRAAHLREVANADEAAAKAAHAAAESAQAVRADERREQIRRDEARAGLRALDARADEIAHARAALAAADAAELLRAPMRAVERADAALAHAREAHTLSLTAWHEAGETVTDRAGVQKRADALLAEVGVLTVAADSERRLSLLVEERASVEEIISTVQGRLDELAERRATLPSLIDDLTAAVARSEARAQGRAAAEAALAAATSIRTAAVEARDRELRRDAAEAVCATTGRALTQASAALDDLRARRFRDHAGELAEALVDGEPCPVCGACEHPHPTSRIDAPVSDADIAAAEGAKTVALAADAEATAAVQTARDELAAARERAGGRTPEDAEEAVEAAERELDATVAAAADRDRLLAQRDTLAAESRDLDTEHAQLTAGVQEASRERAALSRSIEEATATVNTARGDHETVGARLASADRVIGLARTVLAGIDAQEMRTTAATAARTEFDDALAGSPFEDRASVEAALRPPAERERLASEISTFGARRSALTETLLDLELKMLPEEPIDVASGAVALAQTAEARDAAVRRCTAATAAAAQLDEALRATEIAHEAIADLSAEAAVIERLANAVAGRAPNTLKMNLETFVLAAELEEIVGAANLRLGEMTQGRYRLRHTDARAARGAASGLGIEVFDAFTGMARPVQSLSGGETFLASLALALGLAEVVTARAGGIALDTLFIDEGFGSLDADTLDVAMRTLDELRQGGRVIGVISHVEAMKDQLPAQVSVRATSRGDSVIEQGPGAVAGVSAAPAAPVG